MNKLGERIRWIRSQKRMTLKQLAKASGLTISFLSQAERGAVSPSIDSLQKIARAFGLSVGALFDQQQGSSEATLIRKSQRRQASSDTGRLLVETLAGGVLETAMEPRLVRLSAGSAYRPGPSESGLEAFGLVWQGSVDLEWHQAERVRLGPGDSVHIRPRRPYRLVNAGLRQAVFLWIIFGAAR